jgi:hypothetical protein
MERELDPYSLAPWAAYIAGHHLTTLTRWEIAIWHFRSYFEEGRCKVIPSLPIEASELAAAVSALATALGLGAADTFRLGQCSDGWVTRSREMLRGLPPLGCVDSDIDWSSDFAPGSDLLVAIGRIISGALTRHPHLRNCFRLGEHMAEWDAWPGAIPQEDLPHLKDRLAAISKEGSYAFLRDALDVLERRDWTPAWRDRVACGLADPSKEEVTFARLHEYLGRHLRAGAQPAPLITLKHDAVEYFGREFREGEFRRAEWLILRLFCEQPSKNLNRTSIINQANLGCEPHDLAPHITRLRTKLRPAVLAYFAGAPLPENARECFIVSSGNMASGPYRLEVDPQLVKSEPPESRSA